MQRQQARHTFAVALIGAITFGTAPLAHGDDKRPTPDYDGRGEPGAAAASWAPRTPRAAPPPARRATGTTAPRLRTTTVEGIPTPTPIPGRSGSRARSWRPHTWSTSSR